VSGLGVEKPVIVLEIGTAYTKCGFSGEPCPRRILPTTTLINGKTVQVFDHAEQRTEDELREVLVHFLYDIVYMHLMVKTQDRRVVISESIVAPSVFRSILADVLYRHFTFGSVLFAPTPLFALFPLGSETGLVVDCGYSETQIMVSTVTLTLTLT
jgi:actin-related protein 10